MSISNLRVTDFENRGTDEVAYGFVYFSDGQRVAYTSVEGVVADATGGWGAVTGQHVKVAKEHLQEKGVLAAA